MKKSIYDLALETVNPDGGELTENQENEIDALVQFGKRVLENSRLPTQLAPDAHGLAAENDEEPPEFGTGGWMSAR